MGTFAKQLIVQPSVSVHDMTHEGFELCPYYPPIPTECGGGTPMEVPLAGFYPVCQCFAAFLFGNLGQ